MLHLKQTSSGRKEHDPQAWVPLEFTADGVLKNLTNVPRWSPDAEGWEARPPSPNPVLN